MPTKKTPKKTTKKAKKLNKKDLEYYKGLLLKHKEQMLNDIGQMNINSAQANDRDAGDVSGHSLHMADVATDMYDKEFNLTLASKDRELLVKINDALKRIEEGTYGICLGTGNPISKSRLKAIPYAEYCLEHQEKLESEGKIK